MPSSHMQPPSATTGSERRRWPRIPASLLGNVSASLVNGPDVGLVNLSCSGALIEVSARYAMKAFVRLKLVRSGETVTVAAGTVLWSQVSSIVNGQVNYQMAVVFEKPIADMEAATGIRTSDLGTPAPAPSATLVSSNDAIVAEATTPGAPTLEAAAFVIHDEYRSVAPIAPAHLSLERESRLLSELSSANARADAVQAALETRQQEHRQALREQQDRYETMVAEMVKASNELQVEISRLRDAAESDRGESERRILHLQAQLQALESRSAVHEGRNRTLRQEVERLLAVLTAPIDAHLQTAGVMVNGAPDSSHIATTLGE